MYIMILFAALMIAVSPTFAQTQVTKADPNPGTEYQVVHQIGRFDPGGVFHGTDYNTKKYLTMEDCATHYDKTLVEVQERAAEKGANESVQAQHVKMFQSLYACQQITIDLNYEIEKKPVAKKKPETKAEVARDEPPAPEVATGYASSVAATQSRQVPLAMPTRPFWIAEYVSNTPGYRPYWVKGAAAYATINQCHEALREQLTFEKRQIEDRFMRTARDGNAATRYSHELTLFRDRTRTLQCITDGQ